MVRALTGGLHWAGRQLRRLQHHLRYGPDPPGLTLLPWDIPAELDHALRAVQAHTLIDPLRLAMLGGLAHEVVGQIEGDLVECGVYNGGSAAILGAALRGHPHRKLWLYDTFAGLPAPGAKDGPLAAAYAGALPGSIEAVRRVVTNVALPLEQIIFRPGLFQDTFREPLPEPVALLHVDADWYESILVCLRTFYPLMPDGGIIILDDFGHWEGTREAFYDFCVEFGVKPLIERVGYTQAFWRKGQSHNRSSRDQYRRGVYRPRFDGDEERKANPE